MQPANVLPADVHEPEPDDWFWTSRPELEHLRMYARARRASPLAVLGVVLARVVTSVPPSWVLPPIIGREASLNLIVALVAPSGGGKGAAEGCAKGAVLGCTVPQPEPSLGSGEGLAKSFGHAIKDPTGKWVTEIHTPAVLFSMKEVDTLTALNSRQGSTLAPAVRSMWSGEGLGFAYADPAKRVDVPEHAYRACLILGVQPGKAGSLFADSEGGTPQRLLWLPALDPNMPRRRPEAPEPIKWRNPSAIFGRPKHELPVPPSVWDAVDEAAWLRNRGEVDPLDGQAALTRLKVAAALGLYAGRPEVSEEDWHLAGHLMTVSDGVRSGIQATLSRAERARNEVRGKFEGLRAVASDEVKAAAAVKRVSQGVMSKLGTEWVPRKTIRGGFDGDGRKHLDAAIEHLLKAGLVEVREVPGQGRPGVQYRRCGGTS